MLILALEESEDLQLKEVRLSLTNAENEENEQQVRDIKN